MTLITDGCIQYGSNAYFTKGTSAKLRKYLSDIAFFGLSSELIRNVRVEARSTRNPANQVYRLRPLASCCALLGYISGRDSVIS